MAAITVDITGTTDIIKKFDKFNNNVKTQLKNEVNASALKIQSDAKKNAPANLGTLKNSIQLVEQSVNDTKFIYSVGSTVSYAPYIEFGTPGTQSKTNMKIPSGYEDFAKQFQGKSSGKFKDMVLALAEWVTKKGIVASYSIKTQRRVGNKKNNAKKDLSVAWAIAISILRKGIRAQPFLIPAFEAEKPKLIQRIEKILKNA